MDGFQSYIHKLEVGGGMRYVKLGLGVLAVVMLIVLWNWRGFRNFASAEAMDSAQLARNLASGKGYTTQFVRPFSIYLLKRHNEGDPVAIGSGPAAGDPGQIRVDHPDLANPPVYPVILAGLMKVLPFHYETSTTAPFWSNGGRFWRHQPEFVIALFNQVLFFGLIALVMLLGRKLFDSSVAWLTGLLMLATEFFWRFSVSGLSTMLLLVIFAGIVWMLVLFEEEAREPRRGPVWPFVFAGLAGLLVGVGALTRYSFGWLIVPVILFVLAVGGPKRWIFFTLSALMFLLLLGPWVARNIMVSGTPFGTAGYAVLELTGLFPDNRLMRSLEPNLSTTPLMMVWTKLILNLRQLVQEDLPSLGGTWLSAFFLVGLLVNFRSPALRRLRWFIAGSIGTLVLAQALGRTHLSDDAPTFNSENLLVIAAPLVIAYGVALFYLLLDQVHLPFRELRYAIISVFAAVVSLPLILAFLPPKAIPVVFPPYYPPAIETICAWLKPNELIMTDVPWAAAWYGNRQAIWTPPNSRTDFFAVNDYLKPVSALYLSPMTMDARFLTGWVRAGEASWGTFVLEALTKKEPPVWFPLRKSQAGWLPDQLVLTDWERWKRSSAQP